MIYDIPAFRPFFKKVMYVRFIKIDSDEDVASIWGALRRAK